MIHARKAVTATAEGDSSTVTTDDETVAVVPQTTIREFARHKLYAAGKNL